MKKSILAIAVLAAMVTGCKKDDDNNTQSRSEMLVGTWTMSQWGLDANNNDVVDAGETAPASASTMSGKFTFNSNGTASAIASFMGASDTTTGTWALVSGDNYIRTIEDGDTTYMEIKSMSGNSLTVRDTSGASVNAAMWYVLSK